MNCESLLHRYCLLDKYAPLPVGIRIHLLHCKTCRKTIIRMSAAEDVQWHILSAPAVNEDRMLTATMGKIRKLNERTFMPIDVQKKQRMFPWLIAGFFLIGGFILLPVSDVGKFGLQQFGSAFSIPFALLCAGSIIAFAAIFIAKNILFFADKFDISPQI